ncbi:MAG: stage 0 sporulation family protein [Candidatus Omnitrophica bacterium]|nr:stage 0 sporulation family protein [Candidatus Omnitrophota bacterium]
MLVVQVKLREGGKVSLFEISEEIKPKIGDYVIVEQERGFDYGQVLSERETISDLVQGEPVYKVVRLATPEDLNQINKNRRRIKGVINLCLKKIAEHKLNMKLVDAEYSFDRTKIVFYFTAEGRIDFRELVKDLAKAFKVRIELRQIGVRDEARRLGGFGPCGRTLCCATFLKDFEPVTMRMAKDQNLSLNPIKISGLCGRLMCCLSYEACLYQELSRGLPRIGDLVEVEGGGKGRVVDLNILKRTATIELEDGRKVNINYKK